VNEKLDMSHQCMLEPKRSTVSWAAPKAAWPAGPEKGHKRDQRAGTPLL